MTLPFTDNVPPLIDAPKPPLTRFTGWVVPASPDVHGPVLPASIQVDHVGLQVGGVDSQQDDVDAAAEVKHRVAVMIGGGSAEDLGCGLQAVAVEIGFDFQQIGADVEVTDGVAAPGVGAEDEGVAAGIALEVVVAGATGDPVVVGAGPAVAGPAVAGPAGPAVITRSAVEEVIAGAAVQGVVALGAEEDVDGLAAADGVIA